jgi:hypothetical protein
MRDGNDESPSSSSLITPGGQTNSTSGSELPFGEPSADYDKAQNVSMLMVRTPMPARHCPWHDHVVFITFCRGSYQWIGKENRSRSNGSRFQRYKMFLVTALARGLMLRQSRSRVVRVVIG